MIAAFVLAAMSGPARAQTAGADRMLLQGIRGPIGEAVFWAWSSSSGLGPRELSQAGLTPPELLELVCQFADDIDMAHAGGDAEFNSGRALTESADLERARIRARLESRPITESPDLPDDVSARPECVLAPEPEDVAALLADAPGAAPYLIERRLRRYVRRTSTTRILALPDAQQERGDAP